jgi:hypothetical protein
MEGAKPLAPPALHCQPVAGLESNKYCRMCSACVVDSIVQCLGTPQWVRVVKLEEVHTLSWIHMTPGIYFLLAISSVHRYNDWQWRTVAQVCCLCACQPTASFHILSWKFCNITNSYRCPTKQSVQIKSLTENFRHDLKYYRLWIMAS